MNLSIIILFSFRKRCTVVVFFNVKGMKNALNYSLHTNHFVFNDKSSKESEHTKRILIRNVSLTDTYLQLLKNFAIAKNLVKSLVFAPVVFF